MVKRYVRKLKQKRDRKAYIRFETLPGEQAQVDLAEFQIESPEGQIRKVYLFSMVLGYSRNMYAEFLENLTLLPFLQAHQNAFGFFGGLPKEILYDNMKNVVIRRQGKQIQWNQDFSAFAMHYGFRPLAAPPYAPWVKGKVERPFHYIRERFWRGYRFDSIDQANTDLRRWLLSVAVNRCHGTTGQIVSERFQVEKQHLTSLPQRPLDLCLRAYRKVYSDCQIAFLGNRYVLPHEYVGQTVLLKIRDQLVRVFLEDKHITSYRIPEGKGQLLAHPQFYQRLKADQKQNKKKFRLGKGKATLGLKSSSMDVEVMKRPLSAYQQLLDSEGDSCLN